jgi:hypothetical protein
MKTQNVWLARTPVSQLCCFCAIESVSEVDMSSLSEWVRRFRWRR